jgi:hypothetical protein
VLAAVVAAHGPCAAVAGHGAAWWRGIGEMPTPRELDVIIPHGQRVRPVAEPAGVTTHDVEGRRLLARCRRVRVVRSRWLRPDDVETVRGVRVTTPEVTAIHLAGVAPTALRSFLVDARHHGLLDFSVLSTRLQQVGSVRGRHLLGGHLRELEGTHTESPFHDRVLRVLQARGYRPSPAPMEVRSRTGRRLLPDIALADWKIALELDGDAFHRDRAQRRRDRDRLAAYATTDWRPIIVDWRSWQEEHEAVLATIDAAIEHQRDRGIGAPRSPGGL